MRESRQITLKKAAWRAVEERYANKPTYSNADMGSFSRVHRTKLGRRFAWTDVDYVGLDYNANRISLLMELKELPVNQYEPFDPSDAPDDDSGQLMVYWLLSEKIGCPAYLCWYPKDIEDNFRVKIDPITEKNGSVDYRKDERYTYTHVNDFAGFLDSHLE